MAGPVQTLLIGIETRFAMRDLGYGFLEIRRAMANYSPDKIDQAVKMAGPDVVKAFAAAPAGTESVGATGNHPFLDWLTAFLQSDLGKALIAALIAILTGL